MTTNNRPTPETDSRKAHRNASGYNIDPSDLEFMKGLERQRDDALQLARTLADTLHDAHKRLNSFLNRPGGAMALRDSMLVAKCERALAEAKEVLP